LVDWDNLDKWMLEASDFKVVSEHREGLGVMAEATIRIAGIKTRDAILVTGWDPPTMLEISHLGWVKGTGVLRCRPDTHGTRLEWTETLIAPWGIFGRLGMFIVAPMMRKIFQRDLEQLRALVVGP